MKIKIFTLLAILLLTCVGSKAEVSGIPLGYCNGEIVSKGEIVSEEKDAIVNAAIFIPGDLVKTFSGNEIREIKAGLASKLNVTELTVWLRTELDGENLAQGKVSTDTEPKMVKGWNTVALEKPYLIPDDAKGLYVGYSFHQKGSSFGIASLGTPAANALWVKLPGEEWTDRSAEGTLCVEALVYGDKLPKVNLELSNLASPKSYVVDKGILTLTCTVQNLATLTVSGFDVEVKVDGFETVYTSHIDAEIAYKESYNFMIEIKTDIKELSDGETKVSATIVNIKEGEDENPLDNTQETTVNVVQRDFTRYTLIEEFTTEGCPNCPRVASYLHNIMEDENVSSRTFIICHHAAFGTDWLSHHSGSQYTWFFNAGGSTYAPAVMLDRVSYDGNTPVFCPSDEDLFKLQIEYAMSKQAFVSVSLNASYDEENGNLKVDVSGSKSVESLGENTRIVVVLVENNIAARSQAGAGKDYVHQHVLRNVSNVWGDELVFTGDDYEYSCEIPVKSSYVKENLQVIAYVMNYNNQDPNDSEVHNAYGIDIAELFSGVEDVEINRVDDAAEYFNLNGMKVDESSLSKGVYIVKRGNKAEKVVLDR